MAEMYLLYSIPGKDGFSDVTQVFVTHSSNYSGIFMAGMDNEGVGSEGILFEGV